MIRYIIQHCGTLTFTATEAELVKVTIMINYFDEIYPDEDEMDDFILKTYDRDEMRKLILGTEEEGKNYESDESYNQISDNQKTFLRLIS